jgi:hypothetical protein
MTDEGGRPSAGREPGHKLRSPPRKRDLSPKIALPHECGFPRFMGLVPNQQLHADHSTYESGALYRCVSLVMSLRCCQMRFTRSPVQKMEKGLTACVSRAGKSGLAWGRTELAHSAVRATPPGRARSRARNRGWLGRKKTSSSAPRSKWKPATSRAASATAHPPDAAPANRNRNRPPP